MVVRRQNPLRLRHPPARLEDAAIIVRPHRGRPAAPARPQNDIIDQPVQRPRGRPRARAVAVPVDVAEAVPAALPAALPADLPANLPNALPNALPVAPVPQVLDLLVLPIPPVEDLLLCPVCATNRRGALFVPCGHVVCRICAPKVHRIPEGSRIMISNCFFCNNHVTAIVNMFF